MRAAKKKRAARDPAQAKLGRKPKPAGEKKKGWARRLHPKVIDMIPELALADLKSDTELVEDLIRAHHRKTFPERYKDEAAA